MESEQLLPRQMPDSGQCLSTAAAKAYPLKIKWLKHHVVMLTWLFLLSACTIPISYHDATTYKNLTDLKAETMTLVETFDTTPFKKNENKIEDLRLKLRKAYEYEVGKGKNNSDTARQFDKIISLINSTIKDYQEHGAGGLGKKYFEQASLQIGQAFDIAIQTENDKNKDKN